MGARKNHPREAMHRPVHIDADAASPAALLDVSWAFHGPAAHRAGAPVRDGAFLRVSPVGSGSSTARRSDHAGPVKPNTSAHARSSAPRGRLRPLHLVPASRPRPPRPAPPRVRVRQDGVRVVAHPLAMLPGVTHGPSLRLDLHPVPDGIVYVIRTLELRELGDDDKGPVQTGLITAPRLNRFWDTVLHDLPAGRPVIVRLRSDREADLLTLLRMLAPTDVPVVSYRLDESPVGSQRSSYLLPDVDADRVMQLGAERIALEDLRAQEAEDSAGRRSGQVFLSRRRADRFIRRTLPRLHHSLAFTDPADLTDVYVDGSLLRGTRTGGAAAVARDRMWAAHPLQGATLPLEVELEGLVLGHLMAAWGAPPGGEVTIHSDSRAALALLREAHRERLTLGGARGERIRRSLRRLLAAVDLSQAAGVHVNTTWVKGHAGLEGNEFADALARSAARNTAAGVSEGDLHRRLEHIVRLRYAMYAETWNSDCA